MKMRVFVFAFVGVCLVQAPQNIWAQQFLPAGPTQDSTTSLGQFTIVLNPSFSGAFAAASYPGYVASTNRLTSPLLFDSTTTINRSATTQVGSTGYTNGLPVGTPSGLIVSNGSIQTFPSGFPQPLGTDMLFTQINSFNLTNQGGVSVTAGTASGDPKLPPSLGEVTSNSGSSGNTSLDFPAKSFFDVFVDINIPGPTGGTVDLTNGTVYSGSNAISPMGAPLLITNSAITSFPPTVIYTHGGSSAVPVFLGPGGLNGSGLDAGDVVGLLTLAGHGVGYSSSDGTSGTSSTGPSAFEQSYSQMTELPVPQGGYGSQYTPQVWFDSAGNSHTGTDPYSPTYSGWGTPSDPVKVLPEPSTVSLFAVFAGGAAAAWYRRRRQQRRAVANKIS